MNTIDDIKHILYINLESRPDRKKHVEKQLKRIGLKGERFNAIKLPNGALGCSMSHLKCIEMAKQNNWEHILILEDDILFTEPNTFIQQMNKFLENQKDFDVCLIAGNNIPPYNKNTIRATKILNKAINRERYSIYKKKKRCKLL